MFHNGRDFHEPRPHRSGTALRHPRETLADELRALALLFSPRDIVTILTKNAAVAALRARDTGTLEPGKFADIVMLDGNPLEGYWHLLNPKIVIKGGVVMIDRR